MGLGLALSKIFGPVSNISTKIKKKIKKTTQFRYSEDTDFKTLMKKCNMKGLTVTLNHILMGEGCALNKILDQSLTMI